MFQIDTLNISIFGKENINIITAMLWLIVELFLTMFILFIIFTIIIAILDFIKYAFLIELKRKRNDH